jgi:DNA-binding MarR family transcriptional regulator
MHMHVSVKMHAFASIAGPRLEWPVAKTPPSDSSVEVWTGLTRAQQLVLAAVETALKGANLPPLAWYDALWELDRAGDTGLRPFELEQRMLLAQYNLSRLIERVSRAGYVARRACQDDRRGHVLMITAAGRAMRRRMWTVYGPAIQAAIGNLLSEREAERLAALLGTFIARARQTRANLPD